MNARSTVRVASVFIVLLLSVKLLNKIKGKEKIIKDLQRSLIISSVITLLPSSKVTSAEKFLPPKYIASYISFLFSLQLTYIFRCKLGFSSLPTQATESD